MNRKLLGGAAALLLSLSSGASAAEFSFSRVIPSWFSYSYAELEYVDMDEGFSGLAAGLSFDVKPNWNIMGEYLFASTSNSNLDMRIISIGGGYHYQLKNFRNSDLMFHASLMQGRSELFAVGKLLRGDVDDTGIRLGMRVRVEPQPNLEVNADISYDSLFDNDLTFTPGVLYSVNRQLAVKGSFAFGDLDMLSIGVRYYIR